MDNMQREIMFSIVLPIYKVEKYLNKCVDSILSQSYINYEIILVDDGSPDRCPEICDRYAKTDERVKVIHKKNGGLSSARNAGIRAASGKYIIFVDSDDYWNADNALFEIAKRIDANDCDIDVMAFNNIDYSNITRKSIVCNRHYDISFVEHSPKADVLHYYFNGGRFPGAAWVTVTRREFLIEKNLFFIEGIKAEDVDWLLKVFLEADKYSALNEAFYVYQKYRSDSITGTADAKSIDDLLYTIELWVPKMESDNYKPFRDDVLKLLSRHYISAVLIFDHIQKSKKREYIKKLKKFKYLLGYTDNRAVMCVRVLPLALISGLLNTYKQIKTKR